MLPIPLKSSLNFNLYIFVILSIYSFTITLGFAFQNDVAVIQYLQNYQTDAFRQFWGVISDYGDGSLYFVLSILGLIIGYFGQRLFPIRARSVFEFSFLSLASLLSAGIVVRLLKWGIGRPRPKAWLQDGANHLEPFSLLSEFNAFPSGHTQTAFTAAFLLSFLVPRYKIFFFMTAILIGVSRVALLNHWPSDVIMGAAIGTLVPLYISQHCHRFFTGHGMTAFRLKKTKRIR